jgi:hypothetical protein
MIDGAVASLPVKGVHPRLQVGATKSVNSGFQIPLLHILDISVDDSIRVYNHTLIANGLPICFITGRIVQP